MKSKTNTAEFLVKSLEAEGVSYIFGVAGEENLLLLEAIRKSKITFVVTRHEQAAVFMAATVGRWTGKIGVALSTLGPGATNLVTGIAYAQLGGFPILTISGQKPIRESKQGKFQIIPVVDMMKPITKFAATINNGEEVRELFGKSIAAAVGGRPGATHLELPEDVAEDVVKGGYVSLKSVSMAIGTDPAVLKEVVEIITKAEHPILIIGSGANRMPLQKELVAFVEKTKIPFITTQMGKGALDESSELYIGTTALSVGDYVHKAIEHADVVIALGHDSIEKPPAILLCDVQTIIHINSYPTEIERVYCANVQVVGDVAATLSELTKKIKPSKSWDFSRFFQIKDAFQKSLQIPASDKSFPIKPERLVVDIRTAMPKDGVLSLDNGMYKIFIARNYPAHERNTVLLDNALATMGAGFPVGIATKLLYPKRKVLVVAGDGGFMMNVSELETAKRLGLDLVILILNDGGFGMILWKQKEMGFPDFGLKFGNPDFAALAKSFGVSGHRISKTADLLPTLKKALNAKGVHVIDCPVDYSGVNEALGKNLAEEIKELQ